MNTFELKEYGTIQIVNTNYSSTNYVFAFNKFSMSLSMHITYAETSPKAPNILPCNWLYKENYMIDGW